jgi:hypothetical protein
LPSIQKRTGFRPGNRHELLAASRFAARCGIGDLGFCSEDEQALATRRRLAQVGRRVLIILVASRHEARQQAGVLKNLLVAIERKRAGLPVIVDDDLAGLS